MVRPYFTRKNLITIALSMIYSLFLLFVGVCITPTTSSIIERDNPIALLGQGLGFTSVTLEGISGFIALILVAFYVVVFVLAIIYEVRFAKINNLKASSFKMWLIYVVTFIVCVGLSYGVGLLLQSQDAESIKNVSLYLLQAVCISLLIYALVFFVVGAILMLVVNFILIDKPYRYFQKENMAEFEELVEEKKEQDVTSSFASILDNSDAQGVSGASVMGANPIVSENVEKLDDREKVFTALSKIDVLYNGLEKEKEETDEIALDELCTKFRKYLCKQEKLYFDIDVLRFFISGFACSQLSILEGLSGTGKSSLPRYFAQFVNGKVSFFPVQATWRDRTSVLGYFNDFTKSYKETDFLCDLYEANYTKDKINVFVLDEMNISRVEYYFADFLSVLEYPVEDRKLRVMQLPYDFFPPAKLEDGILKIPENVLFVGTANKDDSTFTIADKVYDRANTIYFEKTNEPFEVKEEISSINLSSSYLRHLYQEAINTKEYQMNKDDLEKIEVIINYVYKTFDVTFGNRILNQIKTIVPVFVACGGKKEDAIDFTLSRKLLVKLEGHFEEYVKSGLKKLLEIMSKTYGEGTLKRCEHILNNMLRKL